MPPSLKLLGAAITPVPLLCVGIMGLLSGCAVHYYDKATGTEHLWGVGYMKMRAVPQARDVLPPTNAVMAFTTGVQNIGVSLLAGSEQAGIIAGFDSRSRVTIKSDSSQFYLLWPSNTLWLPRDLQNLFTIRVGPEFPHTNGWFVSVPATTNK